MNNVKFQPDWVSSPGSTLSDYLEENNIPISRLASNAGLTMSFTEKLIAGNVSLTEDVAHKLEHSIGLPTDFWLKREEYYRSEVVRLNASQKSSWLKSLPLNFMFKNEWIEAQTFEHCLKYFDVPSVFQWKDKYTQEFSSTYFRKSGKVKENIPSVLTWIRQGEIQADKTNCKPLNLELFKKNLSTIKSFSRSKPNVAIKKLKQACAECGVALVIAPTPKQCPVNGVMKILSENKAMILLSFRYKSDDHFWFTFFHEAGHLLLHSHQNLILEEEKGSTKMIEEVEANNFASNVLVPKEFRDAFCNMPINTKSIMSLALDIGIASGVLLGQLQYKKRIGFNRLNSLKRKYDWNKIH